MNEGREGFSVLQVMKFKQRLVVPAWLLTSPHHGYILSKRVLMYLRHVIGVFQKVRRLSKALKSTQGCVLV